VEHTIEVALFGENLAYRIGGAERSAYLLAQALRELPGVTVTPVSGVNPHHDRDRDRYGYDGLVEIPVTRLRVRLPFFQYALNSRPVAEHFARSKADLLLANAQAAPMAVNSFGGPSVYFIHDEMSLNVYRGYATSASKQLKFAARFLIDLLFLSHYRSENVKAMRRAKLVVANSEYTARRAEERLGIRPVVVYPQIDVERLARVSIPPAGDREKIMMVGDTPVKGVRTFREIASAMPDHEFLQVGASLGDSTEGNLTLRGFAPDPVEYYRQSRLVLLPSTWEEGFGMVSVEAGAMGIPVLVSDRGGLPETVPSRDYVVEDYMNHGAWVGRIRDVLRDYDAHPPRFREHALGFDMRKQTTKLIEEIHRATGVRLR
jgi:glycosyltransferase involved in cell wall biosynthesis